MPAGPGETLLTTLFADVHYFFNDNQSATKPQHHRFDKQSYVYLFNNPSTRQGKLEIANHAGTPAQDAFYGSLSLASVRQSHLQPNLISLTLDTGSILDHSTWHLPAYSERNDQKYLYKIHALDLYLWTEKDAATLLGHLRSVISPNNLDVKEPPGARAVHAEHRDSMSPVVQQLERTALGAQIPSRAGSTISSSSFPGPPLAPTNAPVAYNPAAPAAPEPVTYREKTPPPPDDGTGTGLKNAQRYENAPPASQFGPTPGMYQTASQGNPPSSFFSGPPSTSSVPGPPSGQPSFGPMAASTIGPASPPPTQQSFQQAPPSFGPAATPTQFSSYPQQLQTHSPPNAAPSTPGFNSNLPPTPSAPPPYFSGQIPPPPPQTQPQGPPVGGYSSYAYTNDAGTASHDVRSGGYTGDVHGQLYRPTESEIKPEKAKRTNTNSSAERNRLEDGVTKFEGKVGKYLNKLDKLW